LLDSPAVITAAAALACLLSTASPTLAVLDLSPHEGVSKDLARTLTELLVVDVREVAPGMRVFGSADIAGMINFHEEKVRLGQRCEDQTCLAEIGGAMGAKEVVTGSLSILGGDYVLVLRRMDVAHAHVLAESSGSAPQTDSAKLRGLVATATRGLFMPAGAASLLERRHGRLLPWVLGGAAVLTLVACVVGWAEVASFDSLRGESQTQAVTYAQAVAAQPAAQTGQVVGIVAAIATGGLGAGAALTW